MKIMQPKEVAFSDLTTDVTNDESDWSAGTYNDGDKAVDGEYVYEALTTTTDQPSVGVDEDPATWVRLGRANKWRMFRDGSDSRSSRTGGIDATVEIPSAITAVALLGNAGASAQVTLTDSSAAVIYDETKTITDIGCDGWWEYYFLDYGGANDLYFTDIPPDAGSELRIQINAFSGSHDAECGRVIMGLEAEIGETLEPVQSRIEDFSRKERDEFGNLTLVTRRTIRIVDYDFNVEHDELAAVQRRFRSLAATPTLFVGNDTMPETIVFGVYEKFNTVINGHTVTECAVSVEEF